MGMSESRITGQKGGTKNIAELACSARELTARAVSSEQSGKQQEF